MVTYLVLFDERIKRVLASDFAFHKILERELNKHINAKYHFFWGVNGRIKKWGIDHSIGARRYSRLDSSSKKSNSKVVWFLNKIQGSNPK